MAVREIQKNIYYVGSMDWDRKLFDALIPLPEGTSYNSYLIKGSEKTALIDTVDPEKYHELEEKLNKLNIEIDYIVANHAEQDHSGSIPFLLKKYKNAKVVTNKKCKEQIKILLMVPEDKIIEIEDKETLSLGDKTLEFMISPWVHWPDTMFTYLKEDKILFSTDFLGSHLATSDLFLADESLIYPGAKRYYAEIMMPFRSHVNKYLKKLETIKIDRICASHGPIYNNPDFIINAYKDWAGDKVKNEVVLPYVSMHGSVGKMVDYFISSLIEKNITVKPFNLVHADCGDLAGALVDAATLVIASPTVLTGPHPLVVYAAYLANALKPKTRFASVIGSFGWGGKMIENIQDLVKNLKVEFIEPVMVKGYPTKDSFDKIDILAENIYNKHKEAGII